MIEAIEQTSELTALKERLDKAAERMKAVFIFIQNASENEIINEVNGR